MACNSCGTPKTKDAVKVTSNYTPKVGEVTKFSEVILKFTIEKNTNVSGENKSDNKRD